jgi:hypothetical protein
LQLQTQGGQLRRSKRDFSTSPSSPENNWKLTDRRSEVKLKLISCLRGALQTEDNHGRSECQQ